MPSFNTFDSGSSSSPYYGQMTSSNGTDKLHSYPNPFPGGGGSIVKAAQGINSPSQLRPPVPQLSPTRPIPSAPQSHMIRQQQMPHSYYTSPSYYNTPYSNFSSYGMYNRPQFPVPNFGPSFNSDPNNPAEQTEESSPAASAFDSIQSFVNAFVSISRMLESTFHAIYYSFRAVVEVGNHLGRMKQVLQTFAIFRFMKHIFKRILYLVGITKMKTEQIESIWNSVSESASDWTNQFVKPKKKSPWPILLYIAFILLGPYLCYRK